MPLNFNKAREKRFIWDNFENGLVFLGGNEKGERTKRRKRHVSIVSQSKIYCPHADLILNFLDVLNASQKMKFRKYYLRKVSPNESDVITVQDIKNLVMYLLITPVSLDFINFFHLRVIDRFLRALIMYFQSYTEIWEEMVAKRSAISTKIVNPLARKIRLKRADEMRVLRCILAREYCELLVGCDESAKYHHMMAGTKSMSMISQSEKDLRLFEPLISIAHRIVWIALQRKYFHLIEIELLRLFRTDAYNTARRKSGMIHHTLFANEMIILHGPKIPPRRNFLTNSPLVHQLFSEFSDFRVVSLGLINFESKDPRINYLKNALLIEEEKLPEMEIKVGILGHRRENYDITLAPIEDEEIVRRESMEAWERKHISIPEKPKKSTGVHKKPTIIPARGQFSEFPGVFPSGKVETKRKTCDGSREKARKKWILRELDRQTQTNADAISVVTSDH